MVNRDLKYICPLCKGKVIWHLNNRSAGATASAVCTNNMSSSRIDWKVNSSIICDWEGKVVRNSDGTIEVYCLKDSSEKLLLPILFNSDI